MKLAQQLKEVAKSRLQALILSVDKETNGAPNGELCDKMVYNTLQAVKIKQFGQDIFYLFMNLKCTHTFVIAEMENIKGISNFMVAALADMQHRFKAYTMKTISVSYSLHLPLFSDQDKSAIDKTESKFY